MLELFESCNLHCYTRERVTREEEEILHHQQPLCIYSLSTTLESYLMQQCTIQIAFHVVTHRQLNSSQHNHATSPNIATPQTTSLS